MTDMKALTTETEILSLPQIKVKNLTIKEDSWSVHYYCEHSSTIFEGEEFYQEFKETIQNLIQKNYVDFRVQEVIRTVPLLVGIFFEKKEIRLYSSRLGRELFLIENIEQLMNHGEDNFSYDHAQYQNLKEHTELVVGLHAKDFPTVYRQTTDKYNLTDLIDNQEFSELEKASGLLVEQLLVHLNRYKSSWFEKVSDFGLDLTARFSLLRIHLLKFLAILPSLDHDEKGVEVKRILIESLRRLLTDSQRAKKLKKNGQEAPLPKTYGLVVSIIHVVAKIFPAGPLAFLVRTSVRFMARRFIAGETIETSEHSLKELFASNRDVTLDQLGELVVSEHEADNYMNEVIKLIRGFGHHVPKGAKNAAGINRAHVSIKVSALCSDFKPHAFDYTYHHVAPRLKKILIEASIQDVFINIDAEHFDYRDIVFKVFQKVLLETPELKDFKATGIVLQAYLRDGSDHLKQIIELAKKRGICMPIRVVKGAYWDAETVEADAHNFNAPEFLNKEETDLHFRQMIIRIFENHPHVQLCLASHNYADHCFAETLREKNYPTIPIIEHQCLHMTYEALSVGLAKMGWVVRNYVPIGSLLVGMAYLVRRIMENSSQVGVLTMMRSHKKKSAMVSPMDVHREKFSEGKIFRDLTQVGMTSEFFNVTPVRLYLDREREYAQGSIDTYKANDLGREFSNQFLNTGNWHQIFSSSDPSTLVGKIQFANREDAKKAIEISDQSYQSGKWAKSSWIERSSILNTAADIMLSERLHLSSLIVYEAGKSIVEALADVDEAIDFLTYYAREEVKHHEINSHAISRGVVGVIAPWNFPLAIPCGMASAALVAGNTVILKSAEQTPLIAQKLVDILHLAGVPQDVLIHLPGLGEEVGDELVNDQRVSGIIFTGSKAVGTMIAKNVSSRIYQNKLFDTSYPAKAITEMGGKNAVIVTANAELDETVSGILYSSFAHAGQKCSAASRVIVHNSIKDRLIERLKEATADMEVTEAYKFSCSINPVITKEDRDRLRRQVLEATEEVKKHGGQVVIDRSSEELPGFCVGPTIIEVPFKQALDKTSFAQRELFGPVVHIIGFDSLAQAIELFNATDYALTGGIFSQSQDDIDYVTSFMECGNLYVNRTITGARVAIEPFGGFKLSGTGPKAGGKGYIPALHVNLNKAELGAELKEEGSEFEVDLASRSRLTVRTRKRKVLRFTGVLLHHFEALFQGIHGENKKVLTKFNKWVGRNLIDFQEGKHFNRRIPGQVSYNDFNQVPEHALVVSTLEVPEFSSLIQVLGAISMGVGVSVCARNEKSFSWWSQILDFYTQAGLSKENFDVYFANSDQTSKSLSHPKLSMVILDCPASSMGEFLKDLYQGDEVSRMTNIITPFDGPEVTDFRRLLANYAWVRAFAVNTMRHGAPMDLEL